MDPNVIDAQDDAEWTDEQKQAWEEYQGKERVADAKYAFVGVERHYPETPSITEAHFTGLTFGGTQKEQKRGMIVREREQKKRAGTDLGERKQT